MVKKSWLQAYRALGDSVLSLAGAEFSALLEDWKKWFIEVVKLLALVFVSLVVFFYIPFLTLFVAIDGLATWLDWSHWAAGLAVLGLALLVIATLGGIAAWLIKTRIAPDNPAATFQRRLDDHRGWWRHQIFEESDSPGGESP
ncbi:MAG: hypothetical protein AAF725_06035 [Acidobacteriota bacterium]